MRSFFARRYARPTYAIGRTEKTLGALILLLLVGIVIAFIVQSATNEDYLFAVDEAIYRVDEAKPEAATGGESLPSMDDLGWPAPERTFYYTPENLYQKIDGRADIYLQYHVVGLTFGTYRHQTDAERMFDVYWYDMGEADNAFGMYRAEEPPEADPVPIGQNGYETGGAVFFWKGASYVQILPASFETADDGAALKIAGRLAEAIEGQDRQHWALELLPEHGRIADSYQYLAQDVFGMDFLTEVHAAKYDLDDGKITLFIRRAADASEAKGLLDKYLEAFERFGRIIWKDPDASRLIAAGEVAGVIDAVFAKGRYLGGAAGSENLDAARKAAVAFYDELNPR